MPLPLDWLHLHWVLRPEFLVALTAAQLLSTATRANPWISPHIILLPRQTPPLVEDLDVVGLCRPLPWMILQ